MTIFEDEEDFAAFEKVLLQAVERCQTRLLTYCLMPNHWQVLGGQNVAISRAAK